MTNSKKARCLFLPFSLFFLLLTGLNACDSSEDVPEVIIEAELSASPTDLTFSADGGNTTVSVVSNQSWTIKSSEDWCNSSVTTSKANAAITITVNASYVEAERTATITISTSETDDVKITITQEAYTPDPQYVSYIEPDKTGMSSEAITLASNIKIGWNLGNTLEAIGGETAWGNPEVSEEMILAVKDAGFNAVRIPCSWDQYLQDEINYRIKESWLERVKEVVDYCVENDQYAILNIHWDGGWLENNCTSDKQEEVNTKLTSLWKQIAIYFRDYDERLLFAGANEPNAENQQQVNVLNTYMQTFVNTVRATGGRNTYRNLIIQAPYTDVDKADEFMTMPSDEIDNRLLAEVHYYSPYQFCLMEEDADWGNMFYFWGEPFHLEGAEERYPNWDCEESYMQAQFLKMKQKLVDNGVPVILGEFAALKRTITESTEWQTKHDESRAYFYKKVVQLSKNNGLIPFFWDPGSGIFDRTTHSISDTLCYTGLIDGANMGEYPY